MSSLADVGLVAVTAAATLGGTGLTIRAQRRLDERHATRDREIRAEDAIRAEKSNLDAIYLEWLHASTAVMVASTIGISIEPGSEREGHMSEQLQPAMRRFINVASAVLLHAPPDVVRAAETFGRAIAEADFNQAGTPTELKAAGSALTERLRSLREAAFFTMRGWPVGLVTTAGPTPPTGD